ELPLPMQVKLLRAIQEKSVRAVGAQGEVPVDVRILSATHKDLSSLVAEGRFRHDLYYRINVIGLVVPPLREREGDLTLLSAAILDRLSRAMKVQPPTLAPDAVAALETYPFPGNVRELENILERALALADGSTIHARDLQLPANSGHAPSAGARSGTSSNAPWPGPTAAPSAPATCSCPPTAAMPARSQAPRWRATPRHRQSPRAARPLPPPTRATSIPSTPRAAPCPRTSKRSSAPPSSRRCRKTATTRPRPRPRWESPSGRCGTSSRSLVSTDTAQRRSLVGAASAAMQRRTRDNHHGPIR